MSDHFPMFANIKISSYYSRLQKYFIRDYKNFDQDTFFSELSRGIQSIIQDETNTDASEQFENFHCFFINKINKHAPLRAARGMNAKESSNHG